MIRKMSRSENFQLVTKITSAAMIVIALIYATIYQQFDRAAYCIGLAILLKD
jgi:hypothetical protein